MKHRKTSPRKIVVPLGGWKGTKKSKFQDHLTLTIQFILSPAADVSQTCGWDPRGGTAKCSRTDKVAICLGAGFELLPKLPLTAASAASAAACVSLWVLFDLSAV